VRLRRRQKPLGVLDDLGRGVFAEDQRLLAALDGDLGGDRRDGHADDRLPVAGEHVRPARVGERAHDASGS